MKSSSSVHFEVTQRNSPRFSNELDHNQVVRDGDTIRALGVPMGNDIDIEAWWTKRYRTVKERTSRWNGLSSLSLTGRNILLQSILYGSMRYWFFTLTVPQTIIKIIEGDAKALLCGPPTRSCARTN